ncbi:MAG: Sec-independent protein translocase protein TatB [Methylophilaceae bacterium]|mgnify:FL=1|jgi:sec-independent protein translocase protein TatB|nr:Sec-independent protein translocase protein TatB [Methylophilaceae bacterium]
MFDISFSELLLIIFALIIFISPKNIPTIARAFGKMLKKSKSFMSDIKDEIEREGKFKELKKIQKEIKKRSIKS